MAFRLPDLPSASGVIHGRAAVLELWGHFSSVWDRLVFDPEETLYDQGDTMIVRTHVQATGGGSGVELDQTLYYALTIRDGLLSRIVPNFSLEEAAKEAGIDPGELPGAPEGLRYSSASRTRVLRREAANRAAERKNEYDEHV